MSDDFKIQWSINLPPAAKWSKGHMLNIRGNTVEEVSQIVDAMLEPPKDEADSGFIDKITTLASLLVGAQVVTDTVHGDGDGDGGSATVTQLPVGDSGGGSFCEHGKREYRSGTSKSGKPWAGWFCPAKAKGCDPVWKSDD